MMLIKPKFWDKKNSLISIFFFPFSLIYLIAIFLKKKFTKIKEFKIPIICVGNIYVGGTGKTPISILLANEIKNFGKKAVILRSFHESHSDEHELIKKKFDNLILSKKRVNGIIEAEKSNFDVVILDDGLQDYAIKKDLSIVCFNHNQLIGNEMIIPSGPLRENLSALKKVDIVIINGDKNKDFENKILKINKYLQIFYSKYVPINLDWFKNKKLFAIAGIGNPENFFKTLEENNIVIEKKLILPDHYRLSEKEVLSIVDIAKKNKLEIVMTEKDYFKFKNFNQKDINYLEVSVQIDQREKFFNMIKNLYDKKI